MTLYGGRNTPSSFMVEYFWFYSSSLLIIVAQSLNIVDGAL